MQRIFAVIRLAAFVLLASFALGSPVRALDTTVSASVCNATLDGSAIFITSPLDDSTIGSSKLTVKGTVSKISQVELYIDGAYSQTKALPPGATTYSMQTSVSKGTHTLRVRGSDLCGGTKQSSNVVVTYQTQVAPTVGSNVPTNTGGTGGVVVGKPLESSNQPGDIVEQQVTNFIPPFLMDIFRTTDLDTLGNVSLVWAAVHVLLLLVGLIMLLFGPRIYRRFAERVLKTDRPIPPYLLRMTRIIGLIMIILAFIV